MLSLRSQPRRRLLACYFTNPAACRYVRELAALLDVDLSNLARELSRLAQQGLSEADVRGRQKYFRLNRRFLFMTKSA